MIEENLEIIEGFVAKLGSKYWGYFGYHDGYTRQMGGFGTIETAEIVKICPESSLDFISSYEYQRNPYEYQDLKRAKIVKIRKNMTSITTTYEIL